MPIVPLPAGCWLAPLIFLSLQSIATPAFAESREVFRLPPPDTVGTVTVERALLRRRSLREYAPASVSLAAVSQLLWAAQGSTAADGRRTAPSAGALYPLELLVVARKVEGLPPGVYRYASAAHALSRIAAGPRPDALVAAASGQVYVGDAPVVVVIAAVQERTAGKYGSRAPRYVAFEAGAAAENLALQAVALDLGAVVVGAFDDAAVAKLLGLGGGEQPLCLMPIGHPP